MFAVEISLIVLFVSSISYIIYQIIDIMNELERYKTRVRVLSTSLQLAEYTTDKPFYTSLANTQTPIEMPEWLYEAIHSKLKTSILGTTNTVDSTKID